MAPLPTYGAANIFVLVGTYYRKVELDRKKYIPWTLLAATTQNLLNGCPPFPALPRLNNNIYHKVDNPTQPPTHRTGLKGER